MLKAPTNPRKLKKKMSKGINLTTAKKARTITIIVPIYNALDDVKKLLESILHSELSNNVETILINDFSEQETTNYLRNFVEEHKEFKLLENEENLGFIKTCNRGMRESSSDIIILLNSDTMIPKLFEKRVLDCFNSNPYIGTASPLSPNSHYWYIPSIKGKDFYEMDAYIMNKSKCKYPLIPTPEGFCFCIRKEVINDIGYLDEIYGRGYREEVDFSLKASRYSWEGVFIDNLYVYHKQHASFGEETKKELIAKNYNIFKPRWKNVYPECLDFINFVRTRAEIHEFYGEFTCNYYLNELPPASSTYTLMYNFIEEKASILDAACGGGVLGYLLKYHKNATIFAFEKNISAIKFAKATKAYEKIDQIDLELLKNSDFPEYKEKFDYIICGDILEHLRNPMQVLILLKSYLKPTGKFIIAIPNIAHASIKASIMNNDFTYTVNGLLDRNNIHLFSYKSLADDLSSHNFFIEDCKFSMPVNIAGYQYKNNFADLPNEVTRTILTDWHSYVIQYVCCLTYEQFKRTEIYENNLEKLNITEENAPDYIIKERQSYIKSK